jgi:hypothetical protein
MAAAERPQVRGSSLTPHATRSRPAGQGGASGAPGIGVPGTQRPWEPRAGHGRVAHDSGQ